MTVSRPMTIEEIQAILQKVIDGEAPLDMLHKALDTVRIKKLDAEEGEEEEFPIGV